MAEEKEKKKTSKATSKKAAPKTTKSKTETKKETKSVTKKVEEKKETPKVTPKKSTPKLVQEKNDYGHTLLAAILILVVFVGGFIAVQHYKNKAKADVVLTEDEKAFKEEYEKLNGTTRSNGQTNKEITILDNNNVKYINLEEAAKILDSGSGVIYFGFAACPWCRNAVPVLLDAMESTSLDTIYYVNVRPDDDPQKDIRDTWTLNTKNKPRKTKDAEDAYYDVLTSLANDLSDYVLVADSGKKVNTGEKRLGAPTVVSVVNGVVVGFHAGTVDGHVKDDKGALRDLTKEETTELFNTYSSLISKYLNSDCSTGEEGC